MKAKIHQLPGRVLRAILIKKDLYEEVGSDRDAIWQACIVVAAVGISDGIGNTGFLGIQGLLSGLAGGIMGWLLWSLVIFLLGVKVFEHTSSLGKLLRCTGFAYSPGMLSFLGIMPDVGIPIRAVSTLWVTAAFVVAVRQALGCSTGRAIFIVLQGFMVFLIIFILVGFSYILF
jgi:hypothetical protein